jgi:bacterioferritin
VKGNQKIITLLNQLLADKLTAISQYMVNAEMCDGWGYAKLHRAIELRAHDERYHAAWLVQRILFLEGKPSVDTPHPIRMGQSVPEMILSDQTHEEMTIHTYQSGITLAQEAADHVTADLLLKILRTEERHAEWAERQRAEIEEMGIAYYLANQAVES